MNKLPQRIKELRQSENMTQAEFGKKFGIVKSTVSLYETGNSTPNDEIKIAIAKYFRVSMDYLMGLSDIKNPYGNLKEETSLDDMDLDIAAHKEGDSEFTESQMNKIAKIVQEQVERIQKEQNKDK